MSIFATIPDRARRDLALAWMNRGHGELLRNDPTGDAAALEAYAQAIALLQTQPPAGDAAWANSLGAACMNHGQLLHRLHGLKRAEAALASFDAAAAVLRGLPDGDSPWPRRNLAGSQVNRANLLLDLGRHADAAAAAREALALSHPTEQAQLVDADLALKARRALGDALGRLLVAPGANQAAIAAEASDVVDDALAVVRHWTARGENAFLALGSRFFRYGTQLYRLHQPHFLAEFIEENLPLGADFRVVALEALDAALAAPPPQPFLTVGDAATERHLQVLRELENLRPRLLA